MNKKQCLEITKFLIAGSTATGVNLIILYILTEFIGFFYLVSIVGAFLIAFIVSFTLQKFWTFADRSTENAHKQVMWFFIMQISGLLVDVLVVYVLVEIFSIWYMTAQFFTLLVIAISNFLIMKFVIFKPKNYDQVEHIL